ncbi:MAG: hypothetical protein PVI81_00165 [Anaerolineales bacterium]|jgi:hypothetical protein
MDQQSSPKSKRWVFGVILGIGVGVALAISLDNIAVGIGAGIGVGLVMAFGIYQKDHDSR